MQIVIVEWPQKRQNKSHYRYGLENIALSYFGQCITRTFQCKNPLWPFHLDICSEALKTFTILAIIDGS